MVIHSVLNKLSLKFQSLFEFRFLLIYNKKVHLEEKTIAKSKEYIKRIERYLTNRYRKFVLTYIFFISNPFSLNFNFLFAFSIVGLSGTNTINIFINTANKHTQLWKV